MNRQQLTAKYKCRKIFAIFFYAGLTTAIVGNALLIRRKYNVFVDVNVLAC